MVLLQFPSLQTATTKDCQKTLMPRLQPGIKSELVGEEVRIGMLKVILAHSWLEDSLTGHYEAKRVSAS